MESNNNLLPIRVRQIMQLPKWIFGICFTIGTLLLAAYMINYSNNDFIMVIGFLYILFAVIINTIVAGTLGICAYLFPEHQNEILTKTAVLLINIPVAILYCYIIFTNFKLY